MKSFLGGLALAMGMALLNGAATPPPSVCLRVPVVDNGTTEDSSGAFVRVFGCVRRTAVWWVVIRRGYVRSCNRTCLPSLGLISSNFLRGRSYFASE